MLTPNDFSSLDEVAERQLAFGARNEQMAKPLKWEFTRGDLATLMARLSSTDENVPLPPDGYVTELSNQSI